MIVVIWLSLFISRFTEGLVSASFLFTLALWGGLAVQTTYCNLSMGASIFYRHYLDAKEADE
ncbi:hypothetical membrane spanning protein [Streptococcus pyogenes]|nr:hypothetical membrane spanning protein [Streptococcus pyogenes]